MVLEGLTVICTGRTEKELDLLSIRLNDFAFCDRSAAIHRTRFYLSQQTKLSFYHYTVPQSILNLVIVIYLGLLPM